MSIESRSRQYGKVFDHWQIKEFLGSGSGGKTAVFRLTRTDSTWGESALKVVSLIAESEPMEACSKFRMQEYRRACDECSRTAEQEVRLMDALRGNTNIVDYLDHTFVDWSDETGFGRDLLIRMELLTALRSEMCSGRKFSEADIRKIGMDICRALIRCHHCHEKIILHRDVKPGNIFRNKDGDYKLGDFGVSRVLDARPGATATTGIGTYEYWPAEQMNGSYDQRVDIYSLGLVLYELSNQNRLPFAAMTYITSKETALRLSGAPIPPPSDVSTALADVILKACAFKPEDRYQDASEFLQALERLDTPATQVPQSSQSDPYATAVAFPGRGKAVSHHQQPDEQLPQTVTERKKTTSGKRSSKWLPLTVLFVFCVGATAALYFQTAKNTPAMQAASPQTAPTVTVPETTSPVADTTVPILETTAVPVRKYVRGEEISLGTYEQDNDPSNGAEPISWIVLEQQDNQVMLISKYCLDCMPYHNKLESVDWAHCSLRQWLHDDFFNIAFTAEEQSRILTVTNENMSHDLAKTSSGENTADRVFILSRTEAENLFASVTARIAAPTAYARAKGAHLNTETRAGWWWLRTTSFLNDHVTYTTSAGGVSTDGREVTRTDAGVRPVIWISAQ